MAIKHSGRNSITPVFSNKHDSGVDIIRKNETVTASLINNVSSPIVQAKAKKKSIKKKIENANELF